MTKTDNDQPALDTVHIQTNGGTIGTNGMAVIAISPAVPEMKKHALLKDEKLDEDITISSESIAEVLKNLPKDTKFSGVTELCSIEKNQNGKVKFGLHDGKRKKSIEAKVYKGKYVQYRDVFQRAFNTTVETKTAVNLKRLIAVLKCIDEVVSDSSKECPVFFQFTKAGDIIMRAKNQKNGQRVISIMKSYTGIEGQFPEYSDFEKDLFKKEETLKSTRDINLKLNLKLKRRSRRIRKVRRVKR